MGYNSRSNSVLACPELRSELSQRQSLRIQPGSLCLPLLEQWHPTGLQTCLGRNSVDRSSMDSEAFGKLLHRHPGGVPIYQFLAIRGTQTGLRTTRILRHRTTLIVVPSSLETYPRPRRSPENTADQRFHRPAGV